MLEDVVCNCLDDLNIQICDLSNKEGISESLLILSREFIFGDGTEVENTTIKFYKVSNFYNLEFVNLEKTTSSFNELQKLLSKENIENIQDWNFYPSINMLSNENGEYFGKIQISDKDCLKINFSVYNDKIFNVLTIVLKNYFIKNKYKTQLVKHVLNIISENKIDIFEATDCRYTDGFWDIALSKSCGFTYFYDKSKDNHYLNFRGFYLSHSCDEFKHKLEILFDNDCQIKSSTRIGSDVADEICVNFRTVDGIFDNVDNFKINFKNTDFFGVVFKEEQQLINNLKVRQFIEYLLKLQSIKLGILDNSTSLLSSGFVIGLINEFAFPVAIVKEQIKLILIGLGYQEDNIQLSDSIAMTDLSKINIIGNISDDIHINSLKTRFSNKAIFIACGLEHDLASVSKQKIVKEFKTRIIESHDRISRDDYIEIGENLATNNKLKQLRESINKCYHQADFFLNYESDKNSPLSKYKMKQQLKRFFNLLHGFPFATPTKDEYAMHLAFSSALRSADLSRQVGAVITSSNGDILATGTNDIPKSGGGLYRSRLNEYNGGIYDDSLGRDYMRGFDSNACEKSGLIDNIYNAVQPYLKDEVSEESLKEIISKSKLKDITEYGRVVHAEMEALMACARGQVSSNGAILYCTTFPCHNCAKHIIAAGIKRVVYIEPYAKSKALPFHFDSVVDEEINPIEDLIKDKLSDESQNKVLFESFIGVGPNLFRQLFKMRDDSRKDKNGLIKPWTPQFINL